VIRATFHLAVIYAKTAMTNVALKEGYAALRRSTQTAFNLAFLDAYNGPVMSDLPTHRYEGTPGQPIVVQAIDNFHWVYTAQVANSSLPGTNRN
jgi:hypothetical protein